MTYGYETRALNNAMMDTLAVAQRKMERIMLGITLPDRKRNTWICQETGVSNIIKAARKAKHRWAGQIARLSEQQIKKKDGETISPDRSDPYDQD